MNTTAMLFLIAFWVTNEQLSTLEPCLVDKNLRLNTIITNTDTTGYPFHLYITENLTKQPWLPQNLIFWYYLFSKRLKSTIQNQCFNNMESLYPFMQIAKPLEIPTGNAEHKLLFTSTCQHVYLYVTLALFFKEIIRSNLIILSYQKS